MRIESPRGDGNMAESDKVRASFVMRIESPRGDGNGGYVRVTRTVKM